MKKMLFANLMHFSLVAGHKLPLLRPVIQKANRVLASHLYRQYQRRGLAAWQPFWIPAFRKLGERRAAYIQAEMNIDPNCARSIGRYHDFEDPIFGVTGHWDDSTPGQHLRVETACDMCDHLDAITQGKGCPEFCRQLVVAMEEGTGQTINPNYQVEVAALLTEGDESCRFVHRIVEK